MLQDRELEVMIEPDLPIARYAHWSLVGGLLKRSQIDFDAHVPLSLTSFDHECHHPSLASD